MSVSQTPDIVCQCPGEITSPPECFNGNYFPLLWEKKSVWDDIDFQECREGQCSDPCLGFSECGTGAVCVSVNHLPTCKCPDGYKVRIFRYYLSPVSWSITIDYRSWTRPMTRVFPRPLTWPSWSAWRTATVAGARATWASAGLRETRVETRAHSDRDLKLVNSIETCGGNSREAWGRQTSSIYVKCHVQSSSDSSRLDPRVRDPSNIHQQQSLVELQIITNVSFKFFTRKKLMKRNLVWSRSSRHYKMKCFKIFSVPFSEEVHQMQPFVNVSSLLGAQ